MDQTKKDFGVLYGQKTTEDALLIYSSYEDSKVSPQTGDFIVLAPRDEDGSKYLARVEAEIYDEDPIFRNQDKTLVAVHYARISERDLSDRDKQKMFSYTYKVKILGTFESDGKDFVTAVRKLPTVSYHARHINQREYDNILNKSNEGGIEIGKLCIGTKILFEDKSIMFDINKLKEKRTMIFAQSGFGKTNLMKVMLYHMISNTTYGKLIFDLNGEYYLKNNVQKTCGFGDIDDSNIRNNLVVYSDKSIPSIYNGHFEFGGNVKINFSNDFSVNDILSNSPGITIAGRNFLEYLDSLPNQDDVHNFLSKIFNEPDPKEVRAFAHQKFSSYLESKKKENKDGTQENGLSISQENRAMLGGVIRQIKSYASIHDNSSKLVTTILNYLKNKKTVIIDLSLKDNFESSLISTILVKKLFENNKAEFTRIENLKEDLFDQKLGVIKAIVFVEEAQNVLSDEFVRTNANPFVRIAKEGRKFGLGLVAITQRPSAISEEIRSQAENFFAMYMGNKKDIKALVESNINYDGVISHFIQNESIVGNLYMVSAKQSFALPVKVLEFEELVKDKLYRDN
ncbi:MAG: ATP-binding protein [Tannerella sp.]|jgi:DNA helicase HerA-like ATPase|nr:ATP-binding protein [Tannerella sp.]